MNGPLRARQARLLSTSLGAGRVLLGAAALACPSIARLWLGPEASTAASRVLTRSLAARDVALGVGALLSRDHPPRLRTWAALAALGDVADAVGARTASSLPRRRRLVVGAVSAAAAVSGALAALSLRCPRK